MLDRLTVDDFKPALGQVFALDLDGAGSMDLELTRAAAYDANAGAQDASGTRSPFSLQFRGPADSILPQRIYRIEHDALGALEIFIVPIGHDETGTRYEAVFT